MYLSTEVTFKSDTPLTSDSAWEGLMGRVRGRSRREELGGGVGGKS